MNNSDVTPDGRLPVEVQLRIPGAWSEPGELIAGLPAGFSLSPEALTMPDGARVGFTPVPADDQFAGIFASSCRQPATQEEMEIVGGYTINAILSGPGGSMDAALRMMKAASAIIKAGGAGVFIDNSAVAHGGENWLEMTDDGSSDAISFAFVGIVRGQSDVWTMGMHVAGFPDLAMRIADMDEEGDMIVDMIRYVYADEKPIAPGHLLGDESKPIFRVEEGRKQRVDNEHGPMFNPYGRLQLVSMRDAAERN